jgi:hypothetical protein
MGNWLSRWSRVHEIGDGVESLDEAFLLRGAEPDGAPSLYLAGIEECAANGGFRNKSLLPGDEDFSHPGVFLRSEYMLPPKVQGVVPIEDG